MKQGLILLTVLLTAFSAFSAQYYVKASRPDNSGTGTSWGTAKRTIQAAVKLTKNGDTVWVTNGTYSPSAEISVTNAIIIRSVNGPDVTIVNGGGSNRCFNLHDSACLINGFTITNGYVSGDYPNWYGGGIYCAGSLPIVSNCVISGNTAGGYEFSAGGGMSGGSAYNCIFSGNTALGGGGMSGGVASNCIFVGNLAEGYFPLFGGFTANGGGGMQGGVSYNCIFSNNVANACGGGKDSGEAYNCTFIDNFSGWGGGGVSCTAYNCLIRRNSASMGGGGSYWGDIYNCTVIENSGGGVSGGTAYNSIIWNNAGDDYGSDYFAATNCCASNLVHGVDGNITNAPLLVSASHIATNSPCRGAANSSYAFGTDVDGEMWLTPPSMGCDEIYGGVVGPIQLSISGETEFCPGHTGTYSIDIQGALTGSVLDFGTGASVTNLIFSMDHTWHSPGFYNVVLTAFNDDYPSGVSVTQTVHVYSAEESARYVSQDLGNDSNSGLSWNTAKKTIQAGIDVQTVIGGLILVSNGHYQVSSEILIDKVVDVIGVNGPAVTTVDGGGSNRCFNLRGNGCLIGGLTIINGLASGSYSDGEGGGIYCLDSTQIVSNCIIRCNFASRDGGGMFGGTAYNCIFTENSADYPGGGGMSGGAAYSCAFNGNLSHESGGGMLGGTAYNCTFLDNSAARYGGGMCSGNAYNCIVWYNLSSISGNNLYNINSYYTCSPDVAHGVAGNITNAPFLVSTSHVTANSPCRGAGSFLYTFGTDMDGEAWLNSPSMGCDEYHGAGTVKGAIRLSIVGTDKLSTDFPGNYSINVQGAVTKNTVDFGDGERTTNALSSLIHKWSTSGVYNVTLTAFNDENSIGISATQTVYVYSEAESAIYVSDYSGRDDRDGKSWKTAKKSIQAGIDAQSLYGGIVRVSNGWHRVSEEIVIDKTVRIISCNGPEVTIIDGGGSNRCFNLGASDCFISGFTITNGFSSDRGGGIFCLNAVPVVSNCIISGNSNRHYNLGGGGMYQGTAYNCIFSGNLADYDNGGGMSYGTAFHCIFRDNRAHDDGGGMFAGTAYNCIFLANTAERYGGGMSDGSANNCTFVGNWGHYYGGSGLHASSAKNCIFWDNGGRWNGELFQSEIYNSCSSALINGINGNITNTPLFVDAANGDFRLQSNSPCINWGNNSAVSNATDLDGNPRIIEDVVDMGAYEYQGTVGLADSDADGINDNWERQHGGNQDSGRVCSNGVNSILGAYIAGLDPNDSDSKFTTVVSGQTLRWNATSGRVYAVYYSTNLLDGFYPLETNIPWTAGCFTDSVHNAEQRFYRIEVRKP